MGEIVHNTRAEINDERPRESCALEEGFQKEKHLVLHSLEAGRLRHRRVSHLRETLN